ncbi:radical SAM protein with 4Fe4S-binding SPASM domain [Natranaerovirga pectinivora]|uniref:Radical SAM protein with 4Fe4S-binding SPASM domain n=1 Tax=Natranaerovirga pectinivora TaxID=682400 RepID=A0A4R3MRH9_9FIRM|nr:radical SAM protein [Natranaerovirga pectinivora]TCT16008.1 radical SAM protein with 4Fe4S-binding SPASM domain [Natranaerovirga pectinivora]
MRKWNVGWGTISKCNMECQFCYSKQKRKGSNDLGFMDWIKFIDENHERISAINYGTGENTLSKDWFKLIEYIRMNYPKIRQALTTNGYLYEATRDNENLNIFIKAIDEVDVSLDFADREKHGKLRGQAKAYEWAINTLGLCYEYDKFSTIVFLGSKVNVTKENIDGLFEIAKKYHAILRMNIFRPTEGIDEKSKEYIIEYDTCKEIIEYIAEKYSILSINDTLFSTILTGNTIEDPSGDRSIRILGDGSITPSTYLIGEGFTVANIKEENVLEKLESNGSIEQVIYEVIPNECKLCFYSEKCSGGVFDRRYLWNGGLERKDPYCPGKFNKKSDCNIKLSNKKFNSVHDGYLPTIFFSPEQGE